MALPPLKYCTVERAARLLNCEMWDIFHWWQRRYIDLNLMVDQVTAIVAIQFSDKDLYKQCRKIEKSKNNASKLELKIMNNDKTFLSVCNEMQNITKIYPPINDLGYAEAKYIFAGLGTISGLITFSVRTKFPCFGEYLEFGLLTDDSKVSFVPANYNSDLSQVFISLDREEEHLEKIHISNLIILEEDLKVLQNFENLTPSKKYDYPNIDLTASFQKVGIKSHPLKDQTILIARNTKNYYLKQGIDLGLKAIATKIKSHNDFSNKGLPSSEQMAKWFTADGIDASKTTRTFDFELILKD